VQPIAKSVISDKYIFFIVIIKIKSK